MPPPNLTAWSAVELTSGHFVHYYRTPEGALWFSAPDTCEALGLRRDQACRFAQRLPPDARRVTDVVHGSGRAIRTTLISERGWIEGILTSRGPLASAAQGFLRQIWSGCTDLGGVL